MTMPRGAARLRHAIKTHVPREPKWRSRSRRRSRNHCPYHHGAHWHGARGGGFCIRARRAGRRLEISIWLKGAIDTRDLVMGGIVAIPVAAIFLCILALVECVCNLLICGQAGVWPQTDVDSGVERSARTYRYPRSRLKIAEIRWVRSASSQSRIIQSSTSLSATTIAPMAQGGLKELQKCSGSLEYQPPAGRSWCRISETA